MNMQPLNSWIDLNDFLRSCTLEQAKDLLRREQRGKQRSRYLLRIHSRLNKLRGEHERRELLGSK